MDDFTNYFKNLGTQKPYLFALAPAAAVFVLNYGYISKSSSADYDSVSGYVKSSGKFDNSTKSYTPIYKIIMMLAVVFYVSLFSTLLYIYKEECGLDYKESAKKASMVSLVPTLVLMLVFIFMGRRNALDWVSSNGNVESSALSVQLTQVFIVYILSVLTINYGYLECEKEVNA